MYGRVLTKQRLGAHKDVWQCVLRAVAVCPQRRGGFMLASGVVVRHTRDNAANSSCGFRVKVLSSPLMGWKRGSLIETWNSKPLE